MVAPAIRPCWPKTKATIGCWSVVEVTSTATPWFTTATLASAPISKPFERRR